MRANIRILGTGDIHMGRRPKRLPSHLDGPDFSTNATWRDIVDFAIQERVDLLALTGDIIDHDNRFFEAYGPLERGVQRLADHRIRTVAVAGNHDFDVLPRLADSLASEYFILLGRQGHWESVRVATEHGPPLRVIGWSFYQAHVYQTPLLQFPHREASREADELCVGLLHGDTRQPDSAYAPVAPTELKGLPVSMWLLGHIHTPQLTRDEGSAPILYPGSPQALDPTENGLHGPWEIEVASDGTFNFQQIPLARLRYETIDVDLSGLAEPEAIDTRIAETLQASLRTHSDIAPHLRHLACHLRLTGKTPFHRTLADRLQALDETLFLETGRASAGVVGVTIATRPAWDLQRLAQGDDPPGILAHTLLMLHDGNEDDATRQLIRQTQERMSGVYNAKPYNPLRGSETGPPDFEEARDWLIRQARLLLDELLAQKPRWPDHASDQLSEN